MLNDRYFLISDFNDLRNLGYHNCISEGVFTNISDANLKGSKTYDNIWIAKQTKQVFTGEYMC